MSQSDLAKSEHAAEEKQRLVKMKNNKYVLNKSIKSNIKTFNLQIDVEYFTILIFRIYQLIFAILFK